MKRLSLSSRFVAAVRGSFQAPIIALCLLLPGCQKLIGLDEAPVVADASIDAGSSDAGRIEDAAADAASEAINASCMKFCQDVGSQCDGTSGPVAYYSPEACVAVCKYYDHTTDAAAGNTFACRAARAESLKILSAVEQPERDTLCAAASVGGGTSEPSVDCGANCTSYCALYQERCDATLDLDECQKECAALQDTGGVNAKDDFGTFPDTVQCRLAHLSVAAADPQAKSVHCTHATLIPRRASDADVQCDLKDVDKSGKPLDRGVFCDNFCNVVTHACAAGDAVYESEAQCKKACENTNGIAQGSVLDSSGDTLGCRRWHAYTAVDSKSKQHCPHANVVGGGHCGPDACVVYCDLVGRVCGDELTASALHNRAGCLAACGGDLPGAQDVGEIPYSVDLGMRSGNSFQCRIFQLTRALAGDTPADVSTACRGAVGGSPCAAGG